MYLFLSRRIYFTIMILAIFFNVFFTSVNAQCTPAATTGDDNITCTGTVSDTSGDAGNDTITIDNTVNDTSFDVGGDFINATTGTGNDTIVNDGQIANIYGDSGNGDGSGDDVITNNGGVLVGIYGDVNGGDGNGNDTITNNGTTTTIFGDSKWGIGSGTDTITNTGTLNVIAGDTTLDDGNGTDTIDNSGTVNNYITGDTYNGDGSGADTITNSGTVNDIYGDTNTGNGTGADAITNSGTVTGTIYGDSVTQEGSGNDTITNSGTVNGDIVAGGGNDTVTLQDGAQVGGNIDGGADYDILAFEFTNTDTTVLDALATDIAAQNPSGGSVSYNGRTYRWTNFEELQQLLTHLGIVGNSAPFQGFCAHTEWSAFDVYTIDANGNGEYAFSVTAGRIVWGLRIAREEYRQIWLNEGNDVAMYALPTGELLLRMIGYDFVFDYVAMCGPLPDEEDPVTDIIVEPEEIETLPVMSIINRPR